MNETLSTIIMKGMNNPDCSFFVGNMVGSFTVTKTAFTVIIFYYVVKLIDKLIIDNGILYINKKLIERKVKDTKNKQWHYFKKRRKK